jgi:hypothetical protein
MAAIGVESGPAGSHDNGRTPALSFSAEMIATDLICWKKPLLAPEGGDYEVRKCSFNNRSVT